MSHTSAPARLGRHPSTVRPRPGRLALAALAALGASVAVGGQALAQGLTRYPDAPSSPEARLIARLHAANRMEIRMGQLARQRVTSAAVLRYATSVERDHRELDHRLQILSGRLGLTLADLPIAVTPREQQEHRITMNRLRASWGVRFEREFLRTMAAEHRKVIDEVVSARPLLYDQEVRAQVDRTLPVLRRHEQVAQRLLDRSGWRWRWR
jgi:putative membrane protein